MSCLKKNLHILSSFLPQIHKRICFQRGEDFKSSVNISDLSKINCSPGRSAGKESACSAGDPGSIPGLGRSPGEGKGYLLQYSGLENSPWGRKESDTTERLSHTHTHTHTLPVLPLYSSLCHLLRILLHWLFTQIFDVQSHNFRITTLNTTQMTPCCYTRQLFPEAGHNHPSLPPVA